MGRVLRPGPASMEGLRWLARVGLAPLEAWRCAMGWSEVATHNLAACEQTRANRAGARPGVQTTAVQAVAHGG
jgi:hypothetical protein